MATRPQAIVEARARSHLHFATAQMAQN